MTKLTQITDCFDIVKYWPRLITLSKAEKTPIEPDTYLQTLLACMKNGVVFAVRVDGSLAGVCCAEGTDGILALRIIPCDKGTGVAKDCITALKTWGSANFYSTLQASTTRFSGSSFRYFEKTLGFRRYSVTFTQKIGD